MTQPMPKQGKQNVTPIARELMIRTLDGAVARGIESYGTTLQTHNGRDAYQDAFEELVDAMQYVVQAKLEMDDLRAENKRLDSTITNMAMAASKACIMCEHDQNDCHKGFDCVARRILDLANAACEPLEAK